MNTDDYEKLKRDLDVAAPKREDDEPERDESRRVRSSPALNWRRRRPSEKRAAKVKVDTRPRPGEIPLKQYLTECAMRDRISYSSAYKYFNSGKLVPTSTRRPGLRTVLIVP